MWFGLGEKVGHQGRPGLAQTPALAFVWVRGNISLLGSGHGPWRRQWGPGGLRICPVCHVGPQAGAAREGRDTHSHTPETPSEQPIQGAGSRRWWLGG